MKALVLAAGQGTRLRQLTRNRPKAMLPIAGKPLLEYILEWLRGYAITDIAVNLHHCPTAIPRYFGDGGQLGVALHYSVEEHLLGSAGAAKRLQSFLDETFVVIYGDVMTNVHLDRLIHFHSLHRSDFINGTAPTLALYRVPNPTQCGLVDTTSDGRVIRFVEKPSSDQVFTDLAFSGIMVCEPGVLEYIPADREFDFGHDLFPQLLSAGVPMWGQALASDELLIDIGTLAGYLRALKTWSALHQSAVA